MAMANADRRSGATASAGPDFRTRLQEWLPKIVLSPSIAMVFVFVYGFILFTIYVSFTDSRILPFVGTGGQDAYDLIGLENYSKLWRLSHWEVAITNIGIFAGLYITLCTIVGLLLAIFLDQKIRGEGVLRPIYLYPMALSFIVTGTAWKWFLDPGIGLENVMQMWGWETFSFDWIKNRDYAIYTIVIAAIWQSSGFTMAMFLAGLRGIDNEMLKAAQIDGASNFQLYWRIIIPQLRPAFLSAIVILAHLAIKSYDLVIAMTGGGPGRASEVPATFMYSYTFSRNQMGIGAASAVIMLMTIAAIMIPYLYSELKEKK